MRFTTAHVALIVLAALPTYLGVRVLVQGLFDRSYDNALVNYLVLGGMLILLAVTLLSSPSRMRDGDERTDAELPHVATGGRPRPASTGADIQQGSTTRPQRTQAPSADRRR